MNLVVIKNRRKYKACLNTFLALLVLLLCRMSLSAHDLGVSSISLEITDGRLVVFSAYARADFGASVLPNNAEDFKAFAKKAVVIEIDGKTLDILDSDASLDNADGLNLRHSCRQNFPQTTSRF